MCIRDRDEVADIDTGSDVTVGNDPAFDSGGDCPLGECVTPVSYTHLRAHETVLDLVCRLLLEKKK